MTSWLVWVTDGTGLLAGESRDVDGFTAASDGIDSSLGPAGVVESADWRSAAVSHSAAVTNKDTRAMSRSARARHRPPQPLVWRVKFISRS